MTLKNDFRKNKIKSVFLKITGKEHFFDQIFYSCLAAWIQNT